MAASFTVTKKFPSNVIPELVATAASTSATLPLIAVTAEASTATDVLALTAVKSVANSLPVAIVIVRALLPSTIVLSVAVSCSLTAAVMTPAVFASILMILATDALPETATFADAPMEILAGVASANVPRFEEVAVKFEFAAVTLPVPIKPEIVNRSAAARVSFAV